MASSSDDGAAGGGAPKTTKDVIQMMEAQGHQEMYAVNPLKWCPHLETVQPLPESGVDLSAPCLECGDTKENWVCLVCYKVFCSRYVNEHMLKHGTTDDHHVCLSYSDLSVWCYSCENYIDNEIVMPAKDDAYKKKFGEA